MMNECRTALRGVICILPSAFCILALACSHAPTPPPAPAPTATPAPPAPAPALAADKRELARQALALFDQHSPDAAAALRRAADAYPEVAPWLKLRIGDAASLTEIIQQTPASSAATVARIRLAALQPERLPDTDCRDDVRSAYQEIRATFPSALASAVQ